MTTTQDLVDYLDTYLHKVWDYQRKASKENPFAFFGKDYWEVRENVQKYQKENLVSGIVWKQVTYRGLTIEFPTVHDQLITIPSDKNILIKHKPIVLKWWDTVTTGMLFFESDNNDIRTLTTKDFIDECVNTRAEWAEVYLWDHAKVLHHNIETGEKWEEPIVELSLQLCWGNPDDVAYFNKTGSGSFWFYAEPNPENNSIQSLEKLL